MLTLSVLYVSLSLTHSHTCTHILLKHNPRIHTSCSKTDTQAVAVSLGPLTFYQHFPTLLTCSFKMTHLQSWTDTCKLAHPDVLTEAFRCVGDRWCSSHFQTQYQVTVWAGSSGKGEREAIWGVGGAGEAGGKEYICKYLWFTCLSGPVWKVCVCVCVCGFNLESFVCVRVCLWLCEWFQAALTEPSPQADPC